MEGIPKEKRKNPKQKSCGKAHNYFGSQGLEFSRYQRWMQDTKCKIEVEQCIPNQ